eukprot:tig00020849_g14641.t1
MSNEYRVPPSLALPSLALVRLASVPALHAALLSVPGRREEAEVGFSDDGATPLVVQVLRMAVNYPIDEVRLNGATAVRLLATAVALLAERGRAALVSRRIADVLCARLVAEAERAAVGALCSLCGEERVQDTIVSRGAMPRLIEAVKVGPAGRSFREAAITVAAVCRNTKHRPSALAQEALSAIYPYALQGATDDPLLTEAVSAAVWPDEAHKKQQRILDALRATALEDRKLVEEVREMQAAEGGRYLAKMRPRERWRRAFQLLRARWAAEKLEREVGSGTVAQREATRVRSFAGARRPGAALSSASSASASASAAAAAVAQQQQQQQQQQPPPADTPGAAFRRGRMAEASEPP